MRIGYESAANASGRKYASASAECAPPSSQAPTEMIAIRLPLQTKKNFSRQRSDATSASTGTRCSSRVATSAKTEIVTSHWRFGPLQLSA